MWRTVRSGERAGPGVGDGARGREGLGHAAETPAAWLVIVPSHAPRPGRAAPRRQDAPCGAPGFQSRAHGATVRLTLFTHTLLSGFTEIRGPLKKREDGICEASVILSGNDFSVRSLSLSPDKASLSCQASPTDLDRGHSGSHSLLPLKTRLPESAPHLLLLICSSSSVSVCVTFVRVSTAALRTAGRLCRRGLHGSRGMTHAVVTATGPCVRLGFPAADGFLGLFLQTDESEG